MLVTSFLLGCFLVIGLLVRRYTAWTRVLIGVAIVVGIILLMWGK